eukprot:scaffold6032_cov100-Cylindrotheca_fusiformis.AAC.3
MNDNTGKGSELFNLYGEVLQACQPFYEFEARPCTPELKLSPRLEDGLSTHNPANPQDSMAATSYEFLECNDNRNAASNCQRCYERHVRTATSSSY